MECPFKNEFSRSLHQIWSTLLGGAAIRQQLASFFQGYFYPNLEGHGKWSLPPKQKSIRPSHGRGEMTGPRANVMTKSQTLTENDTQTAEHRWRKEQVNCNWRWLIKMCIISITHICDMSWLMTGNDTRHATQKILDPRRLTPEGPHISGQKHLSINRSYSLGSVREIGSKPRQGNIMSRAFSWGG